MLESTRRILEDKQLKENIPITITLSPYFWHGDTGVIERINHLAPNRCIGVRLDADKGDRVGILWLSPDEVESRTGTTAYA